MIEMLSGILRKKDPGFAVIDVGGVGFGVSISLQTFEQLPERDERVTLITWLHVKEDALQLFGFHSDDERAMFRLLLGITGIGPKLALNILSGCGAERLRQLVTAGNLGALTAIPGIGKKTAERIIVELRDTLRSIVPGADTPGIAGAERERNEALLALLALGYARSAAEKALHAVFHDANAASESVSEIIRRALKELNG